MNENFLEEDEKVLKLFYNNKKFDDEAVKNFNKKKNFELMQTLEKVLELLILLFSKFAFHI